MTGRHMPFYAGIGAAGVALALVLGLAPNLAVEIPAVAFFLAYLVLTFRRLSSLTAERLEQHAVDADEPVWIILAVTLAAVAVSVASLFSVLNAARAASLAELLLAFASVALGWLTIHLMAAMHYAHLYWRPSRAGSGTREGLDFPRTDRPSAWDFVYFAFVIGMTAQTSDVAITTTAMRTVNLLHAVVSFFFNTVLVAAAVNAAVSLAS